MKNGKRLLLLILLAVLLVGCGTRTPTASERMDELLAGLCDLPAGRLYRSGLSPYEEGDALSDALIAALYSRADGTLEYTGRVEEAAVYLSSGMGEDYLELAVFVCYGSADTEAVAAMCLRRARFVSERVGLAAEEALILRSGRTVLFCLGGPPALRARLARMV